MDESPLDELRRIGQDFARFTMRYKFGIDEVLTKVSILQQEFTAVHDYNPIEHVGSRVKSAESIIEKVRRKGGEISLDTIGGTITDIAGIRITCSFVSDVYRVFELLSAQSDVTVREVKDYIRNPKPNGYKSLHAILEVPVFLTDGPVQVPVELQIRTVAMDFWASLEHKIHYKFRAEVPDHVSSRLKAAADTAAELDATMEQLHDEVRDLRAEAPLKPVDDEIAAASRQLLDTFAAVREDTPPTPA